MISFFVPGKAQPGGSKHSLGKHRIIDANPHVGEWRSTVALVSSIAMRESGVTVPYDAALYAECTFYQLRPAYHFDKLGKVKARYLDAYPTSRPDSSKLFRSTEDAMTKIVYTDDARIVLQKVGKRYGENPGARIIIMTMQEYLANE